MESMLRIGEYKSLGTLPFFHPLKELFNRPYWEFVSGSPDEIGSALENGDLDVALAQPLALIGSPRDFLVFPDAGYGGHGHMREILFFSDMFLDDMDEMTVSLPAGFATVSNIVRLVLGRYLQYQSQYIMGWGNAEAFVLDGDSALRERMLARYSYVYDVGDLWRHYTGQSMAFLMWIVRAESYRNKQDLVDEFHRLVMNSLDISSSDWGRLASMTRDYGWLRKPMFKRLWNQVHYRLDDGHFDGVQRFYEDCADFGLIDDVPEISFLDAAD